MRTNNSLSFAFFLFAVAIIMPIKAQYYVGDPGVGINTALFDDDYPQMERWANAGVNGGIPFPTSYDVTSSIDAGSSADINKAITAMKNRLQAGQKGLITLKNGEYTITSSVNMKSNVSLIGENRDSVICTITMDGSEGFSFDGVSYCGIYNLTIQGGWGVPKYPWNYSLDANREFTNDNISVKLKNGTTNCWLDKVTILNSARDPMRCPANHNTFRDLIVDGCKRKAGGAEGYFFIQGGDNLVTGCYITHLRHISLQGDAVEYNVVYDNNFDQEVSFHTGDNGNNLIEMNRITLPADMPPIEAGETGPYPETENGKPTYFAIMGPWSTQHELSANPNFIFRNSCLQLNHNYGPREPWSGDESVYYGPIQMGLSNQQRIDNFPVYSKGVPDGGTLYAIVLADPIPVTKVVISDTEKDLQVNESVALSATVFPDSATFKAINWETQNSEVVTVDEHGVVLAISEGETYVFVRTEDGLHKDSCLLTVSGILQIPVSSIRLNKTELQIKPEASEQLIATVLPENATDKSMLWQTSDEKVATVKNGLITTIDLGTCDITASTPDDEIKDVCSVTVTNTISYTETFNNLKLDGWGTESYTGDHGNTWHVSAKGISGDINDKGIYFQGGQTGLISGTIKGGIGSFSLDCINKWSTEIPRKLELLVNNKVVGNITYTGSEQYRFTIENINIEGDFTLAIKNASSSDNNNTISIDNITWTSYTSTGLTSMLEINIPKVFPNPFKSELTVSGLKGHELIRLLNFTGKIVCEDTSNGKAEHILALNAATVPKGIYTLQVIGQSIIRSFIVIKE